MDTLDDVFRHAHAWNSWILHLPLVVFGTLVAVGAAELLRRRSSQARHPMSRSEESR
ncbi:hypothetical protein ACQPYA_16495 [Micromonospora sp. CA-263727]|uniref:hypothetical protein n=1 Tax=Micromonospora sp. CA-263727 TaxID=3239967 RepID=UPI003D8A0B9B